jgi:hypothetical protein
MKKLIVLLGVLLTISSNTLLAMPIAFDLDGFNGSSEILPGTPFDCYPGSVCKIRTKVRISLPKTGGSLSFPDVAQIPVPIEVGGGQVPIPYPNLNGSFSVTTGDFFTPSGELANLSVANILDSVDLVSFDISVESESGYKSPSILFIGQDENDQTTEYELFFDPVSVPEPVSFMLLVVGLFLLMARSGSLNRWFRINNT